MFIVLLLLGINIVKSVDDEDLKEYDFDNYDDDEDDGVLKDGLMSIFGNVKLFVYYNLNKDDFYIML